MSSAPYVHDASFYELVHKVLTTQHAQELEDAADRERRIRNRQSFSTVQSVAPIIEGRLPKLSELHEVLCHDLSTSGFSFYVASPPTTESLLVRLAGNGKATFLTAQVMHCRQVADGGETAFLAGCKFTGRVQMSRS